MFWKISLFDASCYVMINSTPNNWDQTAIFISGMLSFHQIQIKRSGRWCGSMIIYVFSSSMFCGIYEQSTYSFLMISSQISPHHLSLPCIIKKNKFISFLWDENISVDLIIYSCFFFGLDLYHVQIIRIYKLFLNDFWYLVYHLHTAYL